MSDKKSDENLLKTWSEAQQKLLTDWLDTLRKLGGTPTLDRRHYQNEEAGVTRPILELFAAESGSWLVGS